MNRRIFGTIVGALVCLIFGWGVFDSIVNDCESNCNMLLLMSVITAFGVIIILETYVLKLKAEGKWHYDSTPTEKPQPSNKFSRALISSWFRISLTTLLLSLPVFWQLSFIVIFGSGMLGLGIELLFRGLTNQIAPEMPE